MPDNVHAMILAELPGRAFELGTFPYWRTSKAILKHCGVRGRTTRTTANHRLCVDIPPMLI